jgi:hypothetical protein
MSENVTSVSRMAERQSSRRCGVPGATDCCASSTPPTRHGFFGLTCKRGNGGRSDRHERYLAAAAILDRLAATVDAIPQDVFIAFSKLEVDDGLLDVERWTEVLRDVGFGSSPETAEDFVRSFIADRMMRRG